jgi:hypothetical protein
MSFPPVIFSITAARNIATQLASYDLPVPTVLAKAVAIDDATTQAATMPRPAVLEMSADQAVAYAATLTHYTPSPTVYQNALAAVSNQAATEAADALRAGGLDDVIRALRPRFDAAAAILHEAVTHGITSATTAQDVIDKGTPEAIAVWQKLTGADTVLARIAAIRVSLSVSLGVAPTVQQMSQVNMTSSLATLGYVDYSAAFTHPDAQAFGATGEFYFRNSPTLGIDWLKLAAFSGGRLRLNTPAEVTAMYNQRTAGRTSVPIDQPH